ncbi:YeiH family protein [Gordonibacter sp. Marseille-P4307]|uniref:YeiH family protein n=1 Tax=Gordonibacter sp. Marseille-P4307 TaxID=2161815 RepID=UPI0019CF5B78|nr:putative sulfate exporter family transporter [Gordonibacter sp. Marseille-P4307]
MNEVKKTILSPRFLAACLATLACSCLGSFLAGLPYLSIVGALVLSLVLGMAFQMWRRAVDYASSGIGFISNKFLRFGIILLGFKLNLAMLAEAGVKSMALSCLVVSLTILAAYNIARRFGVERRLAVLTASGTGICGAAAVMGIASQVADGDENAKRFAEDKVVAVAIVALLGTLFTLIEVFAYPLLGMDPHQFGVLAGGSLHEIAHAVAAGSAAGPDGLDVAIVTKLSRVLLLVPVALVVGVWYRKKEGVGDAPGRRVPVPWFMLGFVATSIIGTFAPLGQETLDFLVKLSYLTLGMAMAALGMSVNFRVLFSRGRNALAAALIASFGLFAFVLFAARTFF